MMPISRVIATAAALVIGLSACDTTGVIQHTFPIDVTGVEAPDTITTAEAMLPVHLFGVIGTNSCYRLLEIRTEWADANRVQIVARGRYEVRGQPCSQGTVYLDEVVEIRPDEGTTFPAGELTVQVIQPAGEPTQHVVQVVEPTED